MAPKILFSPKQPDNIMAIVRELAPPGFDLVAVDPGTPQFIEAAQDAEYYMGLARQMGGEFFRSAPKLKLVQLLSAGYDRVDVEAARKAKVPVSNNGGANAIAVAEHTLTLILVAFLVVYADASDSSYALDAALVVVLLSFVGTLAAARFHSRGGLLK